MATLPTFASNHHDICQQHRKRIHVVLEDSDQLEGDTASSNRDCDSSGKRGNPISIEDITSNLYKAEPPTFIAEDGSMESGGKGCLDVVLENFRGWSGFFPNAKDLNILNRLVLDIQNQMIYDELGAIGTILTSKGKNRALYYPMNNPKFPTISIFNQESEPTVDLGVSRQTFWNIEHYNRKALLKEDSRSKFRQVVTPFRLDPIQLFPIYKHWSSIRTNQFVEDCPVLKFVPYFNEEFSFSNTDTYLQHYSHVDIPSESENEDNTVVDQMYDRLLPSIDQNTATAFTISLNSKLSSMGLDQQWGDWLQKALISSLDISIERLNKRRRISQAAWMVQKQDHLALKALNKQDPQESFYYLFCKHCFIYDCPLHVMQTCSSYNSLPNNFRTKEVSGKCISPPCYKDFASRSEDAWGADEIKRFEKGLEVFNSVEEICQLASLVHTRSCSEVYAYLETQKYQFISEQIHRDRKKGAMLVYGEQPGLYKGSKSTSLVSYPSPKPPSYCFGCSHASKNGSKRASCHIKSFKEPCTKISMCECSLAGKRCGRFCHCTPQVCKTRYLGCNCKAGCSTKQCPCFSMNWECDPDLCSCCSAISRKNFSSDQNTSNNQTGILPTKCNNIGIQNRIGKRLLIGASDISGWGIFAGEQIFSGELISEYTGELITQEEAERRGIIYDIKRTSFLFNLNSDYVVDATYKGNKVRFANHSTRPNAISKVMNVLGTLRIGIFAIEDISHGEEITFDYNYDTSSLKFITKQKANNMKKYG
jgi:hypothetical protein